MNRLPLSIAALALIPAVAACGDPATTSSGDTGALAPASPATSSHKAEIADYALTPYTADQYPKLFAAFGSRIRDVERLRRAAAEKASASPSCDRVEVAELSQDRSSLSDLNYFVDCANTTRFRFSETELASTAPVASETQKAWGEADARSACEDLIRKNTTTPTSVKVHRFLGTSVYKAPATGNVVVTSEFDAKNAFGTEIGYRAKCYFQPGAATGTVEISQRLK
jgi:hypothetical protein